MSEATTSLIVTSSINVLVLSSLYILVALGFAFLFNIVGTLNFAHGAIYMIGGYFCYQLTVSNGLNQWLALLVTVIVIGIFGLLLEKFFFRPFTGNMNRTIVVCIGIIVTLQTSVSIRQGYYVQALPSFAPGNIQLGIISISLERLVTFIIGGILLALVLLFVNRTKIGHQMQAISQNIVGAALQGININNLSGLACAIACGLAAVAGCLMGAYSNLSPYMGDYILLKVLEVVILGGIGSIGGIFFAGLAIGAIDAVLPILLSGATSQVIGLTVIIAILLFRPQGFFGRAG